MHCINSGKNIIEHIFNTSYIYFLRVKLFSYISFLVAGVTGRLLQGRIGRITGLEPEPRVYGSVLPDYRLISSDAQFVDVS